MRKRSIKNAKQFVWGCFHWALVHITRSVLCIKIQPIAKRSQTISLQTQQAVRVEDTRAHVSVTLIARKGFLNTYLITRLMQDHNNNKD